MEFDLREPLARAQLDALHAFGEAFVGVAPPSTFRDRGLPEVLVTGFGRFLHHTENATGRLVSRLVPSAKYPETARGSLSEVDAPAAQFALGWHEAVLPRVGPVALCGMILPVQWGLGPMLLRTQLAKMNPAFVVMNGIAGPRQPLWIELGAANRAAPKVDGSGILRPLEAAPGEGQALLPPGPPAHSCLAAFDALYTEIARTIAEEEGAAEVLTGVAFQTYARPDNNYLCNELTYAACDALQARETPRVFLHWPSELYPRHLDLGTRVVLRAIETELLHGPKERVLGVDVRSK